MLNRFSVTVPVKVTGRDGRGGISSGRGIELEHKGRGDLVDLIRV